MASLTLSWSHFDVIKWNWKALLKELKTGWNTHFRQSKNIKTEFFSGAAPMEPKGRQRGLQHHPLPNSPPGKLTKFTCLFLIYMFTTRKTTHSIIFFLFRPLQLCQNNALNNTCRWQWHSANFYAKLEKKCIALHFNYWMLPISYHSLILSVYCREIYYTDPPAKLRSM